MEDDGTKPSKFEGEYNFNLGSHSTPKSDRRNPFPDVDLLMSHLSMEIPFPLFLTVGQQLMNTEILNLELTFKIHL